MFSHRFNVVQAISATAQAKRDSTGTTTATKGNASKLGGKDGAGPAVPALVPTAEVGADDDEVDDIIEGDGESTS